MNFDFWKNGLFALHRMRRKTPAFGIAGSTNCAPAMPKAGVLRRILKNGLFALHRMRRKTPAFGIAGAQFVLPALIALSCFGIPVSAQTCNPGTKNPSVTVCTPKQNDIVATPTHVQASTTDSNPVTKLQIYVDNALVYQVSAATLDTHIRLSLGNHLLTVQAWDST